MTKVYLNTIAGTKGIGLDGKYGDMEFIESNYKSYDFRKSSGAIVGFGSVMTEFNMTSFKFDRASRLTKCKIINSTYEKSKFRGDYLETVFDQCDFTGLEYTGGNEYGFKFCEFINCTFSESVWVKTYFRNCQFRQCAFGCEMRDSLITCNEFDGADTLPSGIIVVGSEVASKTQVRNR